MNPLHEMQQKPDECHQSNLDLSVKIKIPCEVYSRVVGYLRPVQSWNHAKQLEFEERTTFRLKRYKPDGPT